MEKLGSAVFGSFKLVSIAFLFFIVSCQEAKSGFSINSGGPINSSNQKAFRISGVCPNDGDSVAIVEADRGKDGVLGQSNCVGQKFALDTNLSQRQDGEIRLVAVTKENNVENGRVLVSQEAVFLKSTQSPEVKVTWPQTGGFVNAQNVSRRSVRGNCSGGKQISFSVNSQTLGETRCHRGRFNILLDFSAVNEGPFSLTTMIRNDAGDRSTHTISLVRDTVAPVHAITNVSEGSFVNAEQDKAFVLAGDCNDTEAAVFFLFGTIPMGYSLCDGNRFESVLDFSSFKNFQGELSLIGIVKDIANNASSFGFRLFRDTIVPQISFTAPTHFANQANQKEFVVSGLCDEFGAAIHFFSEEVDLGSTTCKEGVEGSGNGYFRTVLDLSSLPDEILGLSATLEDQVGNSSKASFSVTKDTAPPNIAINNSLAGHVVNFSGMAKVSVDGSCDEEGATIFFAEGDVADELEGVLGQTECESGHFQTDLDLSLSAEGNVRIVAAMEDSVGNRETSALVFVKDSITPMVAFTMPARGSFVNSANLGLVNVAGTCDDAEAKIQISNGEQTLGTVNCDGSIFEANVDLSASSEGVLNLVARIADRAENSSSSTLELIKDAIAPTVAFTSPAAGSFVNSASVSAVNVAGTCDDAEAEIQISNGEQSLGIAVCDGNAFEANVDLSAAAEGAFNLVARIADRAGNSSSSTLDLMKDITSPTVAFTSPAAESFVNSANVSAVNVTGTCDDAEAKIQISNGEQTLGMVNCDGSIFEANVDLSASSEGVLNLMARIVDRAKNSSSSTLNLIKDAIAPTVVFTSPTAGSFVNNASVSAVNVAGTCDDAEAEIQISNGEQFLGAAVCDGNNFDANVDLSAAAEGALNLVVRIADRAGNSSSSTLELIKDAIAPTVAFTSPAEGSFVNSANVSAMNVAGTCDDAEAEIQISNGKQSLGTVDCDGNAFEINLDLSTATEGALNLVVRITDRATNSSSSSLSLIKDATVPTVAFTSPALGSFVNSTNMNAVNVTGACDDAEAEIQILNGEETLGAVNCDGNTFETNLDLSTAAEGTLDLVAKAIDRAGNSSSSTLDLIKDAIIPTVAFTSPAAGSFVNNANVGAVDVFGTCDDVEAEIQISNGGQTLGTAVCDGNAFFANLNLRTAAEGTLDLVARIVDKAENSSSSNLSLIKDAIVPAVAFTSPAAGSFVNSANVRAVNVAGTCNDAEAEIQILSVAGTREGIVCDGNYFETLLDLSAVEEGMFELIVIITDKAANSSSAILNLLKDATVPTVAFTSPAPGSFVNSSNMNAIKVSGTCDDTEAKIQITHDEQTLGSADCDKNNFKAYLDLSAAAEGALNLVAKTIDRAKNSSSSTLDLIKDAIVPTIAFTSPSAGSFVNSANVNAVKISGTCDDAETKIQIAHNEQKLEAIACDGNTFEANLDLSANAEGELNLVATIKDQAGNTGLLVHSLIKDTIAPHLSMIAPILFASRENQSKFMVAGTCGVSRGNIRFFSGETGLGSTQCIAGNESVANGHFRAMLDLSSIPDGVFSLGAAIQDQAQNASEASLLITKDTVVPELALTAFGHDKKFINSINQTRVPIRGNCSEEGAIIVFVGIESASGNLKRPLGQARCQENGLFQVNLDLSSHSEGTLKVVAMVEDETGNSATSVVELVKDATVPTIAFTHPSPESFVNSTNAGAINISGTCNDATARILILDETQILATTNCDGSAFAVSLDLSESREGALNLVASIEDGAGNSADSAINLIKDATVPTVAFTHPSSGSFVNSTNVGAVNFSGTCDDATAGIKISDGMQTLVTANCDGSTFAVSLDLSAVAEGAFNLTASATDKAGNSAISSLELIKDTIVPTVAFTHPTSESFVNSTNVNAVNIAGTCSDGETQIQISEGLQTLATVDCDGSAFEASLDLSASAEGTLTLTASVKDTAGNSASSSLNLIKDVVVPTVVLTVPAEGSFVGSANVNSVSITGTCDDSESQIQITDGMQTLGTAICNDGTFTADLNLSNSEEGTLNLMAKVEDSAGNVNQVGRTLIKDTVAPELAAVPATLFVAEVNQKQFIVAGSCDLLGGKVHFFVNENSLGNADCIRENEEDSLGYFHAALEVDQISDGTFSLSVKVQDLAGNASETSFSITKDTVAPDIVITKPLEESIVNTINVNSVSIQGNCDEEDGKIVLLEGDSELGETLCDGNSFSIDLDLSSREEGPLDVEVHIQDQLGNAEMTTVSLFKDTTVPKTVVINNQSKNFINQVNSKAFEVSGNCEEADAEIHFSFAKENLGKAVCDGKNFSTILDLSSVPEGSVLLTSTIKDASGNLNSSSLELVKDSVPPAFVLIHPDSGSFVGAENTDSVIVSGTCNDADASIQIVEGTNVLATANCDGKSFSTSLDLSSHAEGTTQFAVVVEDKAKNSATSSFNLVKDTVAPKMAFTNPVTDSFINATNVKSIVVSGTCNDPASKIQISDGEKYLETVNCDGSSFSFNLDLSSQEEGALNLEARIVDQAGNSLSSSLNLVKDTTAPTIAFTHPNADSFVNTANVNKVAVSGTCNDSKAQIQISSDTQFLGTTSCDGKIFSAHLDLSRSSEGTLNLMAAIKDPAENSATSSLDLMKDTLAPSMAFVNPVENSFVGSTNMNAVAVSGTCDDPKATIQISVENLSLGIFDCDGSRFVANLDLRETREGTLNLAATIQDQAGNSQTSSLDLMKDVTAPVIAFTHPTPKSFINISNMNAVNVEGTCDDPQAEIQISDGVQSLGTINCDKGAFTANLDLSSNAEGSVSLVATAKDRAGNSQTFTLDLVKDAVAPMIAFAQPAAESFINALNVGAVTFAGTCNDSEAMIQISDGIQTLGTINCNGESFNDELDFNVSAEGKVNLVATIKDRAENSATSSLSLVKDTMAPLIAFTHPETDSFVNSVNMNDVTVSGTCDDSAAKIQISDGVQSLGIINCDGKSFTAELDLSSQKEGTLHLVATIKDEAKNSGTSSLNLTKDATVPEIAFTHPQKDSFVSSANVNAIAVSGTCNDPTAKIQISDGAQSLGTVNCDGESFATNLDLSASSEGTLALVASIKDSAGNTRASTLNLVKDSIVPNIAFVRPLANSFVGSANMRAFAVSGTCNDAQAEIQISDGKLPLGTTNCDGKAFMADLDLSSYEEGALRLVAVIKDRAKNSQNASLDLIKDTLSPEIAFTVPKADSFVNNTNANAITVSGTCNDAQAKIQISDGAQTLGTANCDGKVFATNLDLSSQKEGTLGLVATIEDKARNSSTSSLNLVKDTVVPTIFFTDPTAESFINSSHINSVNIAGNCDDKEAKVQISDGVQTLETANCDGKVFTINLDLSSQKEGTLGLVATIEDKAKNSSTSSLNLVKDTIAPLINFDHLLANNFVGSANVGAFAVSGTCNDPAAKIQISNGNAATCNGESFAADLDLTSYKEGTLNLEAVIQDSAGNTAKSSLNLVKDTVAPSITFSNPLANSFVNSSNVNAFTVSGSCDDREAKIQISDGGTLLETVACDGKVFSTDLDLGEAREGTLGLMAKIVDQAKNSATSSLGLIKDVTAPAIAFTHPEINSFVGNAFVKKVAVSGTCDDSEAKIQISDGARPLGIINCDGKGFATDLDLSSQKEGALHLTATIEDKATNSATSTLGLIKDTLAPEMAFVSPRADSFVNSANVGSVNISGTCSDSGAKIHIFHKEQILGMTNCIDKAFSANLDLKEAQEGALDLMARIEDQAKNSTTSSLNLVKDTTLPTIAFTRPLIDSFVNSANVGAVTVSGTCDEENGNIQLLDGDNVLLGQTSCQKNEFNLVLDFSLNTEGNLNLIAAIEDTAKNIGQTHLRLNKDTVVPVVAVETPVDKSFIGLDQVNAFKVSGSCDDRNSNIHFFMGEKILGSTKCDGSKFSATLDFTSIPEGVLSLLTKIEDSAGNSLSVSLNLTRDTIAPEIAVTDPATESFINASGVRTVKISGTCNEKTGTIRLLDGGQVLGNGTCDGSRFNINLDLSSKKDGKLNLTAIVQDAAKNEGRFNLTLVKDVLPPKVAISFPYPRSFISAKEVKAFNVTGTCDGNGVQIDFSDEERGLGSAVCDGKTFNASLDFSLAWEGALILSVNSRDLAGNTNSLTLPLIKDTVAPKISINTPYRGSYFSSASMKSVSVTGNCNDPQAIVRLTESGQLLGRSACDGKKYSAVIDLSVIHRRNLILEATITDVAGNSKSTSINLTKDTSPPSIALVNPVDGFRITSANVLSPINVSGNCNESEALINLSVDGNVLKKGISCNGTSFNASVDFSTVGEGKKILVANIVDKAKNSTQTSVNFNKEVRPFISIWETSKANESIQLHLKKEGSFDFIVDWGDGSPISRVTSYDDEDIDHTYATPGKYKVVINGLCSGLDGIHNFGNNTNYRRQLVEVPDLGNVGWTDLSSAFFNASHLVRVSGGDTSQVTSMKDMFRKARKVMLDTSSWQTNNVTDMSYLFAGAIDANPDVSKWDTSNVINMEGMFYGAKNAVPDTSAWKTFNVTNMKHLFAKTEKANPDVSNWDTSSVTNLEATFYGALIADPKLGDWDVDQVVTMAQMFERAINANPDVSGWKTVSVSNLMAMFAKTEKANPDVSNWDTSNVTNMRSLFEEAKSANPIVSHWKTGNVVSMRRMFRRAILANPDVSNWDVSNVEDMNAMFEGAIRANPDVSGWETVSVVNFMRIFADAVNARPNVGGWDVSQAVFLLSMFDGAINADPDMGQWNFKTGAISVQNFINGSGLSDAHYSKFLAHLNSINPDFRPKVIKTSAKYHIAVTDVRTQLRNKGWIIDDGGQSSK